VYSVAQTGLKLGQLQTGSGAYQPAVLLKRGQPVPYRYSVVLAFSG
jgi:hypothetical protein